MFPGESTLNQLEKIIEVTGKPNKIDMKAIKSKHTQTMIDSLQAKPQRALASLYPTAPADALDLLSKLLQFNPEKRATIEQAIAHPYMAQFHNLAEGQFQEERNCMPVARSTSGFWCNDLSLLVSLAVVCPRSVRRARVVLRNPDFDRRQQASKNFGVSQILVQEDCGAKETTAQEERDGTGGGGGRGWGGWGGSTVCGVATTWRLPAQQHQAQQSRLSQRCDTALANGIGGTRTTAAADGGAASKQLCKLQPAAAARSAATADTAVFGTKGVLLGIHRVTPAGQQPAAAHDAGVGIRGECGAQEAIGGCSAVDPHLVSSTSFIPLHPPRVTIVCEAARIRRIHFSSSLAVYEDPRSIASQLRIARGANLMINAHMYKLKKRVMEM